MIMTAAQFHKRRAFGHTTHKNVVSQDIYTLLQAYEAATTPNKQIKILVLLYFMCLEYEFSKFGSRDITAGEKKKNLVIQLKHQIEAEVDSPGFQQKFANKIAGESYKGGVQRAAARPGVGTQLKGVYGTESIAPRRGDTAKYGLSTDIPAFGISLLAQAFESDFQINQNMQGTESEAAAHAKLRSLSLPDLFKELHALWGTTTRNSQHFTFFKSADRQPYLATYANGVWSCNGMTPYDTGFRPAMYVMDMARNLYIPDGIGTGSGHFNHSSMLAGKPVLCAGTLEINAGRLTYISNDSGHYKPDRHALGEVLTALSAVQGSMRGVNVMDKGTGKTVPFTRFFR